MLFLSPHVTRFLIPHHSHCDPWDTVSPTSFSGSFLIQQKLERPMGPSRTAGGMPSLFFTVILVHKLEGSRRQLGPFSPLSPCFQMGLQRVTFYSPWLRPASAWQVLHPLWHFTPELLQLSSDTSPASHAGPLGFLSATFPSTVTLHTQATRFLC